MTTAPHLPYIKWYPTDWRADPRLRMCSLSARGLWIELIGYMHEGEPYGHLTINDAIPNMVDISSLVGRPISEVRKAMSELQAKQVYSTDDAGRMFSRRMVRDKEKAEKDRANGKGGGNPKLRGGVNPPDKAQIPETRDQKEDSPADAGSSSKSYAFESGVIRLNERDFELFAKSFSNLDLAAELLSLSQWAETQGKNWFHAVKGALAKRNRDVKANKQKAEQTPFKWNGIEGVI